MCHVELLTTLWKWLSNFSYCYEISLWCQRKWPEGQIPHSSLTLVRTLSLGLALPLTRGGYAVSPQAPFWAWCFSSRKGTKKMDHFYGLVPVLILYDYIHLSRPFIFPFCREKDVKFSGWQLLIVRAMLTSYWLAVWVPILAVSFTCVIGKSSNTICLITNSKQD